MAKRKLEGDSVLLVGIGVDITSRAWLMGGRLTRSGLPRCLLLETGGNRLLGSRELTSSACVGILVGVGGPEMLRRSGVRTRLQ